MTMPHPLGPAFVRFARLSGPTRKPPRAGDRRTTKKHGLQIRVHVRSQGMLMMGGGHRYYLFEWRKPADLETCDQNLLTADERAALT